MAFNSVLRRASKSLLPLTVRAVGSPTTFRRSVPAFLPVATCTRLQNFLRFSSSSMAAAEKPTADNNLIRVLENEIGCAEEPSNDVIPSELPFETEDIIGERTITLHRKFQNEIIKVEVDMPNIELGDEDDDDDAGDNDKNAEDSDASSIPLVVSITKGSGQYMEFGITAFPDEITIDSLSIKNPKDSEDQLAYEGPDFNDLDENLQKAFLKYLEIRGIKPSTTNLLFDYMTNKDNKEYLQWLKNLKNFVEK